MRTRARRSTPQVRYAACTAARAFMACVPPGDAPRFHAALLPPMCLNRYYVAEGVRLYAQESWRRAVGEKGRALVAEHIDAVVGGAWGGGFGLCPGPDGEGGGLVSPRTGAGASR